MCDPLRQLLAAGAGSTALLALAHSRGGTIFVCFPSGCDGLNRLINMGLVALADTEHPFNELRITDRARDVLLEAYCRSGSGL